MEAQAVHRTGSQMVSALPAQRLGLDCWEGRAQERALVGVPTLPPSPTSEGGGFVCLADFGTRVRGCLGFGLRPEPRRGLEQRSEQQ